MQFVINGNTYRREYSLCSSPYYDEPLTIASKRVGNGTVSNFLFEKLKEGDVIQSYPPQGKFYTELNRNNKKNLFPRWRREWNHSAILYTEISSTR